MKISLFIILSIFLISCESQTLIIDNIDLNNWKNDKNGCDEYRIKKIDELKSSKKKLLRLSEVEIIKALGKPDRAELMERSQKMFIYYLGKSSSCKSFTQTESSVKIIRIRFNAMGYCNDSVIIDEKIKG